MARVSSRRSGVQRRDLVFDVVVAVVLAASAVLSQVLVHDDILRTEPGTEPLYWPSVLVAALGPTLPIALRRVYPLTTVLVASALFVLGRAQLDIVEGAATTLAVYLAVYSAALHGRWPRRTPVLALSAALLAGEITREIFFSRDTEDSSLGIKLFILFYNMVILALPWWLGDALRVRQVRERELIAKAEELQREREENARRARFEERVRIARELHDVVAHHVSTMGVQAGAARRVIDKRPDQAQEALHAIEEASRQAVHEMDQLLGFLRREDQVDGLAPQPSLDDLDDLLAQVRAAGLDASLDVNGSRPVLAATMQLSMFRIVQEGLTNVLKHSNSATASVTLAFRPHEVEVEVRDVGTPKAFVMKRNGHGLTGMRERVNLHGGVLRAGVVPEGGFVVSARLPLERP